MRVLACCCALLASAPVNSAENPLVYRPLSSHDHVSAGEAGGPVGVLLRPIAFYARVLSRVDGDRCPSYPTCSAYAREAIARHGALTGLWMMVDRLIRERTEMSSGMKIRLPDGRTRVYDPIDRNDFWLSGRNDE